jgi:nitrate/TMAO reductase-like tetraheme cytochrome c subunit
LDSLSILKNAFEEPEKCQVCHPNHYDEWQTSMHAYSFVDPIFFTLNEIGQQRSNNELDQFCVKCHSPIGSLLQEVPPGFNRNSLSSIARKGIQCDVCHLIKSVTAGKGIDEFRLDKVRVGPIHDPKQNSFHESAFDERFTTSKLCAGCHDVRTQNGFQVEHTSKEWQDSPYSAMGLECQGCHMPVYSGEAAIGAPAREKLHRHTFVGVDIPLVDFPGKDKTIERVDFLLKNSVSMNVTSPLQISRGQEFNINVTINNDKTGHNIPSGTIFERQMWLEIILEDGSGSIQFSSGKLDSNGDLQNRHSDFVKSGSMPIDTSLVLFNGTPFTKGEETLFFWESDFINNNTIAPFENRTVSYQIVAPNSTGQLNLSVRLLFRSFPPYLLRAIGQESLIENVMIFEMESFTQTIPVN